VVYVEAGVGRGDVERPRAGLAGCCSCGSVVEGLFAYGLAMDVGEHLVSGRDYLDFATTLLQRARVFVPRRCRGGVVWCSVAVAAGEVELWLARVVVDVGGVVLDLVDGLLADPEQCAGGQCREGVLDGTIEHRRVDALEGSGEQVGGHHQFDGDKFGVVVAVQAEVDALVAVQRFELGVVLDEPDDEPVAQVEEHITDVAGVFEHRPSVWLGPPSGIVPVIVQRGDDVFGADTDAPADGLARDGGPLEPADVAGFHRRDVVTRACWCGHVVRAGWRCGRDGAGCRQSLDEHVGGVVGEVVEREAGRPGVVGPRARLTMVMWWRSGRDAFAPASSARARALVAHDWLVLASMTASAAQARRRSRRR
jgi:hypothetical protein